MGTSQQQKLHTREAIIDAASRLFRENGIDGVSIAQVMDTAGLTHGGFPRHFGGKQELVEAALRQALNTNEAHAPGLRSDTVVDFAKGYLTAEHLQDRGGGCVYASLGSEMSRASSETRRLLGKSIEKQIEMLSTEDSDDTARGVGSWAAMVGAMVLARIVQEDEIAAKILADTLRFISGSTAGKV